MKIKLIRFFIPLLFVVCMLFGITAFTACGEQGEGGKNENVKAGNYLLEKNDGGTYTVTGVEDENTSELIIPAEYNGIPVTAIAEEAFKNLGNVTKVDIPTSVTEIGKRAFGGCGAITEMTLPFTGASADASASKSVFGYIFGQSDYTGAVGIDQYYGEYEEDYETFYIPASLSVITYTGEIITYGAFSNCDKVSTFVFGTDVAVAEDAAFMNNRFTFVYINSVAIASQLTGAKACGGVLSNDPAVGILDGIEEVGYGVRNMDTNDSYGFAEKNYSLYSNTKEYRFEAESCDYYSALAPAQCDIGANGVPTSGGYYLGGFYPYGGEGKAYMEYRIWSNKDVTVTMIYCCGRRTAIPGGTFKESYRTTVNGVQIIPEEDTSFANLPGETFQWTQWTRYEVCTFELKAGDNVINMHFLPGGQETSTSYGNDMYVDYIAFNTDAVLAWSK